MDMTKKYKKPETITGIINSLLKITKGHERYPHDTAKADGYPITYAQVKDLAKRLRAAQMREKKRTEQMVRELYWRTEQMVRELYWKNKNILKWRTALDDIEMQKTGKLNPLSLKWALIYALEIQNLIHHYGFEKKYAKRDSANPYDTTTIDKKKGSK